MWNGCEVKSFYWRLYYRKLREGSPFAFTICQWCHQCDIKHFLHSIHIVVAMRVSCIWPGRGCWMTGLDGSHQLPPLSSLPSIVDMEGSLVYVRNWAMNKVNLQLCWVINFPIKRDSCVCVCVCFFGRIHWVQGQLGLSWWWKCIITGWLIQIGSTINQCRCACPCFVVLYIQNNTLTLRYDRIVIRQCLSSICTCIPKLFVSK